MLEAASGSQQDQAAYPQGCCLHNTGALSPLCHPPPCPTPQEQAGAPSRAHGPAQMQSIFFHPLYIVVGPTESHRELQGGRVVALGMWDWICLVAQPWLSKHRPADTAPPRSQRYRCLEGFQDTQQFPARSS